MFETLSERLGSAFDQLKRKKTLHEKDIDHTLREIRIALIEADVSLSVVKEFITQVKEKITGEEILKSVSPGQMIIKYVNDHLVSLMGEKCDELDLNATPPVVILMVGLQGSGKTTTTGKLGLKLKKQGKKVLMASLDIYRPAAQDQLDILGTQIGVNTLPIIKGQKPVKIAKRALDTGKKEGYDVVLLDTAGRLQIDDELMDEVKEVRSSVNPHETLLVVDSMMGQEAVHVAESFHQKLDLTGLILTRVDGDARGGAALSVRHVTKCPVKFMGVGEKLDELEAFHPERIASRILGMGDIVTLVEKAAETIKQEDAEKLAEKLDKGEFTLDDLAKQIKQMKKMGGMSSLINMLPGAKKIQQKMSQSKFDEGRIKRQEAILSSMTPLERKRPELIKASRKKRIAQGSGTSIPDINKLLKQFADMKKMMKRVKKMGGTSALEEQFSKMLQK